MEEVIKYDFIYEFDLKGYFNTVKLDGLAKQMHRFGIPKFMILHLIALSSGDINNILPEELLRLGANESWVKAWNKYEFIHKYRAG